MAASRALAPSALCALPARPARRVLARAEPPVGGAKVKREYREDEDSVTVPGVAPAARKTAEALYVDASGPAPPRKQDNMSREMKERLRREYTGLGGAENKLDMAPALPPSARLPFVVAAASVETVEAAASGAAEEQQGAALEGRPEGSTQLQAQASTSAPAGPVRSSKWAIDESENLRSSPEHRAWTWTSIALMAATLQHATTQVSSSEDAVVVGVAVFLAYVLADLGTGVYHWGVDNYGDGNTPVFGRQIAAFQGHHQRPWTITQREFANNVHQVFMPAAYPAMLLLAASPSMPLAWNAWSSSFLFLVCMSQQFHAWSHMKKSELPAAVVALQDAGLLIGRRMHGAHHRAPFEGNYCIVSGWWNPILDSTEAFRKMEKAIHASTGVEPRCWHEPEYDWRELERPDAAATLAP